jgi:ParB family transcriptional regulator, chromosome partitioning protein
MKCKGERNSENDDLDAVEEPTRTSEERKIPRPKRPIMVNVDDIVLGNGGRKIDDRKLKPLERSMADQGLQSPIQIYKTGNPHKGKFGLAAGQHRLQAAKNLGWQSVPAVVITREEAKAWRASENLHRNDINELQKSLAIVEYAEERKQLPRVKAGVPKGGRQPHDEGYAQLARNSGYSRKRIAEAHLHATLPNSVKNAILARRKLNKRATLNLLAEMKTEEAQLRFIRGHSHAAPAKKQAGAKISKPTPSKPPTSKPKDSMAVFALKRKWEAAPFRAFYEAQPARARKEFIRQVLN